MKYFRFLIVVTLVVAMLNNSMSAIAIIGHVTSALLMLYITKNFRVLNNLGKYVILFTFWISLMFMPAFHLVKSLQDAESNYGYRIRDIDYERLLDFGAVVLLLTCLSWLFFSMFNNNKHRAKIEYIPTPVSKGTIRIIFSVMYALSLLSLFLGLSKMGGDSVALPFHLSGIITLIRVVFFPILFAGIVENYILRNKKIPKEFFILFFVWSLLEVIVRLSKGALVSSFLVVAIVMYIYYRPNIRTVVKLAAPIFVFFILLYPIVDIMRSEGGHSLKENFFAASQQASEEGATANPLLQPLNRAFMIPGMYAKDYSYLNQQRLFDFSKASVIIAWGGSARYQTFVIDGYPLGIPHSSGTTALEDPLLIGGYGFCFVVIVLLVMFATLLDSLQYKHMYTVHIALIMLLWSFSNSQNISSLIEAVGLQYLIARFFAIWVVYSMNFKTKRIG